MGGRERVAVMESVVLGSPGWVGVVGGVDTTFRSVVSRSSSSAASSGIKASGFKFLFLFFR